MSVHRSIIRPVAAVSALVFLALAAGCSRPAAPGGAGTPAAASANAAAPGKAPSRLGDLSAFQRIATEVAATVEKGDLPAARARIKDLELAWDAAEAGLKPRAADDWHVLDKSIDQALEALRAETPRQAQCAAALARLLARFEALQGKG